MYILGARDNLNNYIFIKDSFNSYLGHGLGIFNWNHKSDVGNLFILNF